MGRLAKTYGMLPSEVAARATTYDLMVTDVLASYEIYEQHKASGKLMPMDNAFSEQELLEMMEKVK